MARRGTSPFTHEDDATAPIHPANIKHLDAFFYGDDVPPKHEMEAVILGPPAFGSPDPRTLGHVMHPLDDIPSPSPHLDAAFEELQGRDEMPTPLGGTVNIVITEDELNEMSKAEVFELATNAGLNPSSKASKSDMIDLILGEENLDEDDEDGSSDADEDE